MVVINVNSIQTHSPPKAIGIKTPGSEGASESAIAIKVTLSACLLESSMSAKNLLASLSHAARVLH